MAGPFLVFPHQLFHDLVERKPDKVYLVEDERFFTRFDFHKKKLVLHRASMKAFQQRLEEKEIEVKYIEFDEELEDVFSAEETLQLFDVVDHRLEERLTKLSGKNQVDLQIEKTHCFLTSMEENQEILDETGYFHKKYYQHQRKRLDVLVDNEGKPEGGKWSFDPENREKLPEDVETPDIPEFRNEFVEDAEKYVEQNFPDNPGELENLFFPTTRDQALKALDNFLEDRIQDFGPYQDALDEDLKFGYHSLLSSSLNIGLLTPEEVIDRTLDFHEENDFRMNSLEGFIRQVIGWREYIRALYELEGEQMRQSNFWEIEGEIPDGFYKAGTGIDPLDISIENAIENGYCHHIERLMVLGNFFLLTETDPDDVYRWFMEMFVDSYDWVMVPNVYGMSQYAYPDMMTKPYISSSNYILKMSNYSEGDWAEIWDALYWRFIHRYRDRIEDIQRMSFMTFHLDRMSEEKIDDYCETAEEFLETHR